MRVATVPRRSSEMAHSRLTFPAVGRNLSAIGDVLERYLPNAARVLELASGSGEHAVAFQRRFPSLIWQASDPDPRHCLSINAWIEHVGLACTMPPALPIDVLARPWPSLANGSGFDAFVCINLLHISAPNCTSGLFAGAAERAEVGAVLIVYGPFMRDGIHTSPSNAAFDASLRRQNSAWGVRDLAWVQQQGVPFGWTLQQIEAMPANNFTLVFGMEDSPSTLPGERCEDPAT